MGTRRQKKQGQAQREPSARFAALFAALLCLASVTESAARPEIRISDFTAGFTRTDGLFPLYRNPRDGALYLELAADKVDREFILLTMTLNGAPQLGHFRGAYRDNRIVVFRRHFNRVEIVAPNINLYFDPENPLARARDANVTDAVLAVADIVAESVDGARLLVAADPLFLTDALHEPKPLSHQASRANSRPARDLRLGTLSTDKTKTARLRNYPQNTDIIVDYVYDNPAPLKPVGADIADPRSVTIRLQHSLVALPDDGYRPRHDDFRVGYYAQRADDMTATGPAPYRDLITRWRLEKADPDAGISNPVRPIVWWIENTTPYAYRDTVREAVLAWNAAFEAIGFSNALQVRVQPDDADWDAGDLRYNVIRWTSSWNRPFAGYGPSFINPRTGEILGADIMLEWGGVALKTRRGEALAATPASPAQFRAEHMQACEYGDFLYADLLADQALLEARGAATDEIDQLTVQTVRRLVMHEIGHTLGLSHNMRASQATPFAHLHAAKDGALLGGSVMDYTPLNIAPKGGAQGRYQIDKLGAYDHWAIAFGYMPGLDDPSSEERQALLARSTEPQLAFGNDADAMRDPARGIDPRTQPHDWSDDAIAWAETRMDLVEEAMKALPFRARHDESFERINDLYLIAANRMRWAARTAVRYVGGVYVERGQAGQFGDGRKPYTPVPYEDQKRAMDLLAARIFADGALAPPPGLAAYLQPQRRGFDFMDATEDPKLHHISLTIQKDALEHLLHPATLQRLTDARLYGNRYSAQAMLQDLTDAVFAREMFEQPSPLRQNLQTEYITRLQSLIANDKADHVARAAATAALDRIAPRVGAWDWLMDSESRAHRAHLRRLLAAR